MLWPSFTRSKKIPLYALSQKHLELYASGLDYNKIHVEFSMSTKSLSDHIHKHNNRVEGVGFCSSCRRVKSGLDRTLAKRS